MPAWATSTRQWYVVPHDLMPGVPIQGVYVPSEGWYDGPDPETMAAIRGPVSTCADAAAVATAWTVDEGRRSKLYLVLAVDGRVAHSMVFVLNSRYESSDVSRRGKRTSTVFLPRPRRASRS